MGNQFSSFDDYERYAQDPKSALQLALEYIKEHEKDLDPRNPNLAVVRVHARNLLIQAIARSTKEAAERSPPTLQALTQDTAGSLLNLDEETRSFWKNYVDIRDKANISEPGESYDFIIVGAGTAGCVLARELIKKIKRISILVLEAGPCDAQINDKIHAPFDASALWGTSGCDWGYRTQVQKMKGTVDPNRTVTNPSFAFPRGKVWGGSSSTNAMIYMRGQRHEYDKWAAQGREYHEIWNWGKCLEAFKETESNARPEPDAAFQSLHGFDGLLHVQDSNNGIYTVMQDVIDTAKKLNIPENIDFNGSTQNGVGKYQVTMKDGRRWSFADGYLNDALKNKIEAHSKPIGDLQSGKYVAVLNGVNVKSESRVTRILWGKNKGPNGEAIAMGVEYIYQGEKYKVHLNPDGELLLSAGAINSPQILMLSGIGPTAQLQNAEIKTNIEVLVDLPVGRNLWDHPLCTVTASIDRPTMQTDLHAWSNGPEVAIFHKGEEHGKIPDKAHFDNEKPDIQHSCSASIFDQSIANPPDPKVAPFSGDGFTLAPVLNIPESIGWLELKSDNPIDPPKIFVNYYDKPSDLYRMMSAVKLARKLIRSMNPSLNAKELGFKDKYGHWQSGNEMTDEEYENYIRAKTYTSFHPCGTTKMAPREKGGVVDHHLRVYGTKHLRVVDASIFPEIPSGNLNAPTGMVAWRASTFIIEEYKKRTGLQ
ncbi:hypothetical protein BC938DRAFT_471618 [Jimgerdemannia flammicorona]|uniref:Glucose-methanol-choline oxidoreductase N-terminal domain-containing protein n=1 Tax=Jimgerdemannia flammicorona TaxID=994334 RepID=A0A433QUM2_9FUNG|nr:hypothetical protein BC938DRAFT_471618 [Jimgerdemannia flammicorona]